nr:MAG TPA: hypothetical protein [Caudoviricetes sp.]
MYNSTFVHILGIKNRGYSIRTLKSLYLFDLADQCVPYLIYKRCYEVHAHGNGGYMCSYAKDLIKVFHILSRSFFTS